MNFLTPSSSTYPTVKPGSPALSVGFGVGRVDSLTPKLEWKQSQEDKVSYDLVVYEAIKEEGYGTGAPVPGPRVYYRKGITETSHRIEARLKPNTQYFWSIRIRKGEQVSRWSTYDYNDFMQRQRNAPFTFKTPKDEE
jgi:hypothetical protein